MRQAVLNVRIDQPTKDEFTAICEELGLSTSQAVSVFAKAVIRHGGIPFEIRTGRVPSPSTLAAMKELEEGNGSVATSLDQLFHDLDN